jgi:hypothetical protein
VLKALRTGWDGKELYLQTGIRIPGRSPLDCARLVTAFRVRGLVPEGEGRETERLPSFSLNRLNHFNRLNLTEPGPSENREERMPGCLRRLPPGDKSPDTESGDKSPQSKGLRPGSWALSLFPRGL